MKKLFLILTLFVLVLSCGGDKGGEAGKAGGGTVTLNFEQEPKTIDPQLTTDTTATKINALIVEGLTRQDETGAPVPGIAEKWDVSEDGLVWTFHLRDAKWENGDPVTANDFKFAWLRALESKNAAEYAYMLFPIKGAQAFNEDKGSAEDVGIKVIDDKTLEVTLTNPTAYFAALISYQTFTPLNEKYYNEQGDQYALDAGKIMANGPYKLVKWTHNESFELTRNENYWNNAETKIDNVRAKLISDASASLSAFKNDELDLTLITVEQYPEFKEDKRLTPYDDGSTWYLEYNLKNDFLANKKIRQALTMAIDKEELGSILQAMGKPAYGYVPGFVQGVDKSFRDEAGDTFPHYNPEEAKRLFAEGLKELGLEKAPKLTLIFNDQGNNKKIAEYVQEKIRKELGYDLAVESLPFKERLQRMTQKTFEIVLAGWSGDYNDALSYMDLWVTNGGNNHTSYSNPKYDELIQIAQTSPDQKARIQAMIEAEKLLGDDMPIGMLYFRQKMFLVNPGLKNMKFKPVGSEYYLTDAHVE